MKKFALLIPALMAASILSAQNTIMLPEVEQPHQIVVYGNDLYIFDEADYSLKVYSISPFELKSKIGKKGDGPHDFKYLPFVFVQPESLAVTDFTKTVWFSKNGDVLKVKNYEDLDNFNLSAEMLLFPVKGNFVQITADHEAFKRHVFLLDSEFNTIKELYEGSFIWRTEAPIHYRTDTTVSLDRIFISDTAKGFYFRLFDTEGNLLKIIDKSQDIEEIPGKPLLHQFNVSDGKIYAVTNKKKDDKTEMIVLDLKGQILKRFYLPLTSIQPKRGVLRFDLFYVNNNKLYEILRDEDTGHWKLLITNL